MLNIILRISLSVLSSRY